MGGERRGSPGAAVGIVLLTLVLTAVLGGCAWLVGLDWCHSGLTTCSGGEGESTGSVIFFGVLAGLCLVGGLVWAARTAVGGGHPGRTWQVAEPGTSLTESPGGGGMLMRLAAGTVVVEGEVRGDFIRVAVLPGNQMGWVERQALR